MEEEMERKYLIGNADIFSNLLSLIDLPRITTQRMFLDYNLGDFSSKQREYRYFDTADGDITNLFSSSSATAAGPLEMRGISMSARSRGEDYILTVKLPKPDHPEERTESELRIPSSDTDFYTLEPRNFEHWPPVRRIMEICKYKPLQEIIRLEVSTNRVDLYQSNQRRIELAIDYVKGKVPHPFLNLQKDFYELEIERKKDGNMEDINKIAAFFESRFSNPDIIKSSLPKWIKALYLLRGQEITTD